MAKIIRQEKKEKLKTKTCYNCKELIQYTESEITISTKIITRSGGVSEFKNLVCPNCNTTISWLK